MTTEMSEEDHTRSGRILVPNVLCGFFLLTKYYTYFLIKRKFMKKLEIFLYCI